MMMHMQQIILAIETMVTLGTEGVPINMIHVITLSISTHSVVNELKGYIEKE